MPDKELDDFDDANPIFKIFADIGVQIGHLTRQLKEQHYWQKNAYRQDQPVLNKIPFSGQCNASGFGLFLNSLFVDGPDQGHIWYLRSITVGGLDPLATVTGAKGVLWVSAADAPATTATTLAIGMADVADIYASLPITQKYTRGAVPLRLNESLLLAVSGAPANQFIGGNLWIEDFEEAAMKQDWAL